MSQSYIILIATRNASKGREMAEIMGAAGFDLITLTDMPNPGDEVEETGSTYAENAGLKAIAAAKAHGMISVGDDAGLEIDFLGGEPGLRSRRFLGEETTFPEKMVHILEVMQGVPEEQRGCRFMCAVAIATPDGRLFHCEGKLEGRIGHEMRGEHGFGYDPIFFLPELGKHLAEFPPAEKHKMSHRGKALACTKEVLDRLLAEN